MIPELFLGRRIDEVVCMAVYDSVSRPASLSSCRCGGCFRSTLVIFPPLPQVQSKCWSSVPYLQVAYSFGTLPASEILCSQDSDSRDVEQGGSGDATTHDECCAWEADVLNVYLFVLL